MAVAIVADSFMLRISVILSIAFEKRPYVLTFIQIQSNLCKPDNFIGVASDVYQIYSFQHHRRDEYYYRNLSLETSWHFDCSI